MFILGLTGPIASGKSSVAKYLQEKGFLVINVDAVGHELLESSSPIHSQIIEFFQTADRLKLRDIVFGDLTKLQQLNALVHPLIKIRVRGQLDEMRNSTMSSDLKVVIEAALLFEIGLVEYCDKILGVWAEESILAERLAGKGWSASMLAKVLAVQKDKEFLLGNCDWFVENIASKEELKNELAVLKI